MERVSRLAEFARSFSGELPEWWQRMGNEARAEYLRLHPRSRFGHYSAAPVLQNLDAKQHSVVEQFAHALTGPRGRLTKAAERNLTPAAMTGSAIAAIATDLRAACGDPAAQHASDVAASSEARAVRFNPADQTGAQRPAPGVATNPAGPAPTPGPTPSAPHAAPRGPKAKPGLKSLDEYVQRAGAKSLAATGLMVVGVAGLAAAGVPLSVWTPDLIKGVHSALNPADDDEELTKKFCNSVVDHLRKGVPEATIKNSFVAAKPGTLSVAPTYQAQ